jgi:putative membrane protein
VSNSTGVRLRLVLLAILLAVCVVCAIDPVSRSDWILENLLVVAAIGALWWSRRWLPLTDASVWLLFVFLALHEIGSHYTYAKVPYDAWFEWLTGRTFNSLFGWQRNHYDRLIHFLFGFFLAVPIRELFLRLVRARGFTSYWLPVQMTMSWSAIYEVLEWLTVIVFGGDLGAAFLGTQGDELDAYKDMALALTGALLSMTIVAIVNKAKGTDLQRDWLEHHVPSLKRPVA